MRGGRRWRWLSYGPPCLDLGPELGWAIKKMGGSDAPHLHLRSDTTSGAIPLGLSATPHSASRRPPTNPQHDAKKARMKETRLGKKCRDDSHDKGAVPALDRRKKIRLQPAVVLQWRWAAATTPPRPTHTARLRPHIARRSRCGDGSLSAMCRLRARRVFFCAALNKRPSLFGVSWWSAGFAQGGAK